MGLFDGSNDGGGLMGMYANPQMAGLLGMSQGLLSASGPSRIPVSMGQAMGAGMQGMQQNAGNALQMQQQLLRMRAMQGLMGDPSQGAQPQPQQPQQPNPAMAQGAPVSGGANTGPMSGLSAGMGGMAPQIPPSQQPASAAPASPGIYGKTPQQLFQQGMLMNMAGMQGGGDLMRIAVEHDPTLAMQMPTDLQKNAAAAYGQGTPGYTNALQATVNKGGTVVGRAGGYLQGPNGTTWLPNVPAGGMPVMGPNGPTGAVTTQPGATDITSNMAYAKTAGEGGALPFSGVDLTGKPLPVTNRTAAATQAGATTPASAAIVQTESGGNPNAVSSKGAQGAWQVMPNTKSNPGFGVQPAQNGTRAELDRVGQDYYNAMTNRYGNPTLGAVAYNMGPGATDAWIKNGANWEALPQETRNYVGKVSTLTALNSGAGAPQSQPGSSGAIYAAPPMGATTAANASQGAPSEQMKAAYGAMSNIDSNYQASRQALQTMIGIAQNAGPLDTASRFIPEQYATKLDPTAAEYEKQYANYVSMQGKALGGESTGGTDQSRGMLANSVPGWDKPQAAKLSGLNTQLQQLDMNHLKTQFLTPIYTQGNEKAFIAHSAAFDNSVKPEMMPSIAPVLQMSGPQQQAAVQAAVKANPALRPAFETLFNGGMLK